MTMTVEDSEKILEAEKQSDVTCGVIHNWLFEPPEKGMNWGINKNTGAKQDFFSVIGIKKYAH